jgi:hypothetical protein
MPLEFPLCAAAADAWATVEGLGKNLNLYYGQLYNVCVETKSHNHS